MSGLLSKQTGVFLRTPKYAITSKAGTWKEKKYQLALNRVTIFETLASLIGILALIYAAVVNNFGIIPILAIYVSGYLLVLFMTLTHSVSKQLGS